MSIYIEFIIIQQLLMHTLTFISSAIITNQSFNIKLIIKNCFFMELIILNLYFHIPFLFIYIYILLTHLWLFKKNGIIFNISYMISYYALGQFLLMTNHTCIYVDGLYILQTLSLISIVLFIIAFIIVIIHNFKIKEQLIVDRLFYNACFEYDGKHYNLHLFLDTGNDSRYKGKPVIFVKRNILNIKATDIMKVNGISGFCEVDIVCLDQIEINHQIYKDVAIGLVDTINHKGDGLLNIAYLYRG